MPQPHLANQTQRFSDLVSVLMIRMVGVCMELFMVNSLFAFCQLTMMVNDCAPMKMRLVLFVVTQQT
jgi:hypothetical protein